jgi:two-component system, LytTR family, sensor histidine kinase AlgZ
MTRARKQDGRAQRSALSPGNQRGGNEEPFLPDLCAAPRVISVVVAGELLAIVLTLAPGTHEPGMWQRLALSSLFIQWIGLASVGLLCLARRRLGRIGDAPAAVVSLLLLLAITLAVSEAATWVDQYAGLQLHLPAQWLHEFALRNLVISAIIGGVLLRYLYVQHQWRRQVQAEASARIQALQARIRPHFLFNTLNTIVGLIRSRPELAERAVEDLSEVFRASLAEARLVPLEQELAVARRYLDLEELRLGPRLKLEWQVDSVPRDALIPWLVIQPLLENALYHGIERLPGGGPLAVSGTLERGRITFDIRNPVPPSGPDSPRRGLRMAQENVRQRLAAHFQDQAGLSLDRSDHDYRVKLWFPYVTDAPAHRR